MKLVNAKGAWLHSVAIIALLLTALVGCQPPAQAQGTSYVPIQWGHTGLWGDPTRTGEGLIPLVTLIDERPFAFLKVSVVHGTTEVSFSAQGFLEEQCFRGDCEFILYDRDEVNTDAVSRGALWLSTEGGRLRWSVLVNDTGDGVVREGLLEQAIQPSSTYIGWCIRPGGFGPHPPAADPRFCYD